MKWVRDTTGRFSQRPYFEAGELDYGCEDAVTAFLLQKNQVVSYPISTNDLVILLEQHTSDLDLYADLSGEGEDVEGMTEFIPNGKPQVRIAQVLLDQTNRENRLRTTLTHELGHVTFHAFLWSAGEYTQPRLIPDYVPTASPRCKREAIIGASQVDWMEWQAGYASGAYLMAITPLRQLVQAFWTEHELNAPGSTRVTDQLVHQVQSRFRVSSDAARVRLSQLGWLHSLGTPPLF